MTHSLAACVFYLIGLGGKRPGRNVNASTDIFVSVYSTFGGIRRVLSYNSCCLFNNSPCVCPPDVAG